VQVLPTTATVGTGETLQFTASVTGLQVLHRRIAG
jgi:hypothetical protein